MPEKIKVKRAKLLRIERKKNRVFIEGAAIQQKHQKPTQQGQKGKILKKEGPIHYSNVLLYSEKSKKGERICTVGEGKNKKRVVISEKSAALLILRYRFLFHQNPLTTNL